MAGSADLKDAFNAVSTPRFTCALATLSYRQISGQEWQILMFRGTDDKGEPFEIDSGTDVKRGEDLKVHARRLAQKLLDQGKPAS